MTTVHPMDPETQITGNLDAKSVADKAKHVAETAKDSVYDVRERATSAAHDARDRAEYEFERGKEQIGAARDEAERAVKSNPGLAVAGALGVGVLIGMALTSRR